LTALTVEGLKSAKPTYEAKMFLKENVALLFQNLLGGEFILQLLVEIIG
jgi:hypothetical protein